MSFGTVRRKSIRRQSTDESATGRIIPQLHNKNDAEAGVSTYLWNLSIPLGSIEKEKSPGVFSRHIQKINMHHFLTSFLLLTCSTLLCAQSRISGKVIDATTEAPIPYVNIGIRQLATGTVSDSEGGYTLKVPRPDQIVTFSSIGYETTDIPGEALQRDGVVLMQKKQYLIPRVEVVAPRFNGEDQIFGERNKSRGHSVGFGSRQLGTEIGAAIRIEKPTYIKSAHFVLNHAKGDSLLFRVNIYAFRDGRAEENLLPENVLLRAEQERGTLSVDLSAYNLVLEEDVVLSLEWIRDDAGRGNVGITFDTKRGRNLRGIYSRITSIAPFEKLSYRRQLKPCFYFTGKTL